MESSCGISFVVGSLRGQDTADGATGSSPPVKAFAVCLPAVLPVILPYFTPVNPR